MNRYNIKPLIDGDNVMDWPRGLRHGPAVVLASDYDALAAELDAVASAIGTSEYLDPPDGGSVTLAEQVARMRAERDALRKDARRYRFIKRWVRRLDIVGYSLTCNEHFEPRIDEAMEQSHDPK